MIHPEDRKREIWDIVVLVTAILSAVLVPLAVVFGFSGRAGIVSLNVVTTIVFTFDIYVMFNTAFSSQGKLVEDKQQVARRYLSTTFAIDIVAALPIWLVIAIVAPGAGHPILLLTVNVLVKMLRANPTLRKLGGNAVNPAILRLVLLVFWFLIAAHVVACGWIFIGGPPPDLDRMSRYALSFYWTITTLTTIGYGDITPSSNPEILYVVIIELLGAGMYGLVIGNIANLIANIDVAKSQYKEKLEKINAFLKYRSIPTALQRKINDYYNYLWESRRGYDESSVLEDLPDALKVSVSLYLSKEIIEKVPIFEKASDDLIRDIIMNLEPVVFTPSDHIVTSGELGFDMFFISRGSVDVVSADEKTVYATLTTGQFFGEIALLLSIPRTATIIAREYCDLYRLDKDKFDRVLTRHPEFAETIQELAERRRAENEKVAVQNSAEGSKSEESVPDPVPDKVEQLTATHHGYEIALEWGAAPRASHYEIVRKDPKSDKWNYLSNNVTIPVFTDKLIMPDKSNVYCVRAVGITGPGPWSDPLVVKKPRR